MRGLETIKVAILFVSANFLAADFIQQQELPILLEAADAGRVTLLPIMLGPTSVKLTRLEKYQMVNSTPLSEMSFSEQEKMWADLVERVEKLLTR
jgi:hypothetical protein